MSHVVIMLMSELLLIALELGHKVFDILYDVSKEIQGETFFL